MQKSAADSRSISEKTGEYARIVCMAMITFYRTFLSPLKPTVCRFYPSCSLYTYEAVYKYGVLKGMAMGIKRVLKCHPFNPGGYDPVK